MLEQVENLHNFYARFLPQQSLSAIVPMVILIAVFPPQLGGWIDFDGHCTACALIFMILVGLQLQIAAKNMATPFSLRCTILIAYAV